MTCRPARDAAGETRPDPGRAGVSDRHPATPVLYVTGGASGIGRAVAVLAAAQGSTVVIVDRDLAAAVRVTAEIQRNGGAPAAAAVECEVSSPAAVERAFREAAKEVGPPTGLFNSAGVDIGGLATELSAETWDTVIGTNLRGSFLASKQALAMFVQNGTAGAIVLCSSPAAFAGYPAGGALAYSTSKGGVSAMVTSLAIEYARYGIRVNAVVPGATDTPLMWTNTRPEDRAALRAQLAGEIPLGRLARPQEPARAVLWLLSDQASYVTGSHLVCDGGVMAKSALSF